LLTTSGLTSAREKPILSYERVKIAGDARFSRVAIKFVLRILELRIIKLL
jgi:hypothetical protein